MLRIPNPGSDLNVFIRIFRELHKDLEGKRDFDMDAISASMAAKSNVSSQGAFGDEALRRSTKEDRSRDQIYNQSKMYAELYRTLGWLHSTTAKLVFSFSYLGDHIGHATDPNTLLPDCLLGMAYPNEVLEVKGDLRVRPFAAILRAMAALDGCISRDEMIVGPMSIEDDRDPKLFARMVATLKEARTKRGGIEKLIGQVSAQRGISQISMGNYTRFPIAAIQNVGWAEKTGGKFHLTKIGTDKVEQLNKLVDFRVDDYRALPAAARYPFVRASFYRMLERVGFDTSPVAKQLEQDEQLLLKHKVVEPKAALFSPFQQIGYVEMTKALPEAYKAKEENSTNYLLTDAVVATGHAGSRAKTMTISYETTVQAATEEMSTASVRAEILRYLTANKGDIPHAVESLFQSYREANQDVFYPLVSHLFILLGYDCRLSRRGRNYERADATIVDSKGSVPIEIKSPGEEVEISVKGVRQALENKVVLIAREQFPVDPKDTSLVVGYEPPAERSEVHELIENIDTAFDVKVGVVDFRSLLVLATTVVSTGKRLKLDGFKLLKGLIRVARTPAK